MTIFEYVSVLLAIVLGLSVTRTMVGIAIFVGSVQRKGRDWLVAGWCLGLMFLQAIWWIIGWFRFHDLEVFALGAIFYWITATAVISIAAYALVPHLDQEASIGPSSEPPIRRAFYGCLAAHFGIVLASYLWTEESLAAYMVTAIAFVLTVSGCFLRTLT